MSAARATKDENRVERATAASSGPRPALTAGKQASWHLTTDDCFQSRKTLRAQRLCGEILTLPPELKCTRREPRFLGKVSDNA